jgi:hypothetical protein
VVAGVAVAGAAVAGAAVLLQAAKPNTITIASSKHTSFFDVFFMLSSL